jgi:hypothetical protein
MPLVPTLLIFERRGAHPRPTGTARQIDAEASAGTGVTHRTRSADPRG